MKTAPIPANDFERLRALYALNLLDSKPDQSFDRITRICRELFDVPSTAVCLVDENRVWLKSMQGINVCEIPRSTSICGHTICTETTDVPNSRLVLISDMLKDQRFEDNPLVVDGPKIRMYMAFILQSADGLNLGTLCLMDSKPRLVTKHEKELLIDLGLILQERLNELAIDANFDLEHVAMVSNITTRVFEDMELQLKKRGVSVTEWRVLDKVIQSDAATPTKISKKTGLSPSQISKTIGILESKGLIERKFNVSEDRRVTQLECNERGKDIWQYGQRIGDKVVDLLREQ